jgi:hypothetical protein
MSVKTFKSVAVAMPPWTSMLLRANHGVGKSKVVRQVSATIRKNLIKQAKEGAKFKNIDGDVIDLAKYRELVDNPDFYPVIDRRLSQMTEGDMVGLPSTDGETTRFNPPDWYKRACIMPCVIFLDELNRATPEVMQAAFQIVLDRELNGWKLHPLSRVYAAINASAIYTVNEMDPALLDRFYAIDLEPSLKEFCVWARDNDPVQGGDLHPNVPDFIETTTKHTGENWLYPPKNAESGAVHPSPRSWEMVDRAHKFAGLEEDPTNELFYHMLLGFVGVEAAIAYRDFCKSVDNRITGDELVNQYLEPRVMAKVNRMGQGRLNDVVDKVADYVIKQCTSLNDKQGANVKALMNFLPQELRISLWSKLTAQGIDKIELAKSIHKHCASTVLDVFGVPMGEAGIGVIPNIPGIFKAPAPKK